MIEVQKIESVIRDCLDTLAKQHGDETFVSDGYAYYEDAVIMLTGAVTSLLVGKDG